MIIWKKKLIECCKCHKKYSFDDNLFYHLKEYILVCPNCNLMHKVDIQLLGKEYEGLKKVDKLNLTAIDIGVEAKDRSSQYAGRYTVINKENPANESGKITSIEIFAKTGYAAVNFEIATFYVVSGNNLSTRSSVVIGPVTVGSKQIFTKDVNGNDISLDVVIGDYIGECPASTSYIEADFSGGGGTWNYNGDKIPCTNQAFDLATTRVISLYGTGATPAGWPHKWNGVTIGKLNGAVISKWNGVA